MFEIEPQAGPTPEPHRALYLRWRPRRFEDVVGQEHVTRTLRNAVSTGRLAHAYLLTGPRGTGKTSIARILFRAANCDFAQDGDPCNQCERCRAALEGRALDLIEIDAASNRGIDDMRDLRDKVAYRPGEGRYKVYIIDEAHELTPQAWDAFLKTLEEPPPHAIFVLATTEAHKVPATIVSRCQRFDLRRIPFQSARDALERIAEAEGMRIEPAVLERLALTARGSLRDAESLLDQLAAFAGGEIDMVVARAALSLPAIEAVRGVLDGLSRHDPAAVMAVLSDVAEGGADLRLFVDELVVNLRAVLLVRTGADARLGDELPADEIDWLRARAPAWAVGGLMRLIERLSEALARTRDAQQFQVQAEVALLEACQAERLAAPPRPLEPPLERLPAEAKPAVVNGAQRAVVDEAQAEPPLAQAGVAAGQPVVEPQPAATPSMSIEPSEPSQPGKAEPAQPGERAQLATADMTGSASAAGVAAAADPPGVPAPAGQVSAPERAQLAEPATPAEKPVQAPAQPVEEAARPAAVLDDAALRRGWPDVVEHVKGHKPLVAALLSSARPLGVEGNVLTVAFGTDFNRKRAEMSANRQAIEAGLQHAFGQAYRLRCTLAAADGQPSLLDDPVINYATRTFGGVPRRIPADQE